jgi:small multidrug resistance pump
VVVVVGYLVAFLLLSRVIADLGVAPVYAAWSGLGTVGAAIGGWAVFSERLTPGALVGMALVVAGVIVMGRYGGAHPTA